MKEELKETTAIAQKDVSRRQFLGFAGLAGASLLVASCGKDDDPEPADGVIDLGSEDMGLLNYMFALKQLSAAIYTRVASGFYANATEAEQEIIAEIRDHEIAHRELLRNILGADGIEQVQFYLDNKIDLTSRTEVLNVARDIEQKMISGFLGIAGRFASAQYLDQLAKMASVDGRHIAYISDAISYNNFGGGLDANLEDTAMTPAEVMASLAKYYPREVSFSHLPKQ